MNRLSHLEPKHWALIVTFLTADATLIGGLDHWADLVKPALVSGLLMQLATLIGAIFVGAPQNPNLTPIENPARRADDVPLGNVSDETRSRL
jgi:hypothetical protein